MKIPYSRQEIVQEDLDAVCAVLTSDFLTQGPSVPSFEDAFARLHGAAHGVAVSNATAALHIGCLALGVTAGDLVWTSPISFVASANCALYCGADIDFVDIDPQTRNISIEALSEKLSKAAALGRLPKVVVPVDYAGFPADMEAIRDLANRYGFRILEDASHAVGASYKGRPVGSGLADITVFSFHPVKIITTGEGGLCLTNDAGIAESLRQLRSHGITRDVAQMSGQPDGPWYYEQISLGYNYRMTDIQAALGLSQLARLSDRHARRIELAGRYDRLLADLPLRLPARSQDRVSAHHLYTVETSQDRAHLFEVLRDNGILVNVHYIPIHLQPYYRELGFKAGDFPNAENFYRGAITLPLFPALREDEQDHVVGTLRRHLT